MAWRQWTAVSPDAAAFQEFWRPVPSTAEPLTLPVAHPIVCHASRRAMRLNLEYLGPANQGQRVIQLPPRMLDGSDMVPVLNQYVRLVAKWRRRTSGSRGSSACRSQRSFQSSSKNPAAKIFPG